MSRAKKSLFAITLALGVFGFASPAGALVIHEEVTIDTDQLVGPPLPGEGGLLSLCLVIGAGNPPTCIRI